MSALSDGVDWEFDEALKYIAATSPRNVNHKSASTTLAASSLKTKESDSNGKEHVAVPNNSTDPIGEDAPDSTGLGNIWRIFDSINLPQEGKVPALPQDVRQEKPEPTGEALNAFGSGAQNDARGYRSDGALTNLIKHRVVESEDPGHLTSVQQSTQALENTLTARQLKRRRHKENQRIKAQRKAKQTSPKASDASQANREQPRDTARVASPQKGTSASQLNGEPKPKPVTNKTVEDGGTRPPPPSLVPNSILKPIGDYHLAIGHDSRYKQETEHAIVSPASPELAPKAAGKPGAYQAPTSTPMAKHLGSAGVDNEKSAPLTATADDTKSQQPLALRTPNKWADAAAQYHLDMQPTRTLVARNAKSSQPGQAGDHKKSRNLESFPVADPFSALQSSSSKKPDDIPLRTGLKDGKRDGFESKMPTLGQVIDSAKRTALAFKPEQSSVEAATAKSASKSRRAKIYHEIRPLEEVETVDLYWKLLLKLMQRFPEDKVTLLNPSALIMDSQNDTGLHIFIDASNILIGFHEQLKRTRNIPESSRVPVVHPSFASLALLLERRRAVTKRVLVGSSPHVEVYTQAKTCGYELNILDKVWKARELTERQKFFALRDAARANGNSGSDEASSGAAAGSSGNAVAQPRPKWVEQGVDEVLNNKMGESLADTPDPPQNATKRPTAVLATGDAQQAEYSSGFGAWARRMLKHGWNVEVAAWSSSISKEYYAMQKEPGWKGRFQVIKLDDFAEELFHLEE
ncbi:MAG: hypothetical protein Q9159_006110 [Coniocarpon cinnabarinum]